MKYSLLLMAIAVVMVSVSSCDTSAGKATSSPTAAASLTPASTENVEQAVRQLDNERTQAVLKSDTAFIERVYADDYVVIGANGSVRNKAQVIADFKSGALKLESYKDDELKVRVYGDTAILTGRSTGTTKDKGQEISGQFLFTRVYVNRNGQWRLATHHISKVTQP
jgi:uncharacterized protein (TIGR02246 family)